MESGGADPLQPITRETRPEQGLCRGTISVQARKTRIEKSASGRSNQLADPVQRLAESFRSRGAASILASVRNSHRLTRERVVLMDK
jgi:hypothetical protein